MMSHVDQQLRNWLARFEPSISPNGGLPLQEFLTGVRSRLAIPHDVGEHWTAFDDMLRSGGLGSLPEPMASAWSKAGENGADAQLDLLSERSVDPIWIPLLLPRPPHGQAFVTYIGWLRRPLSRDVATCVAIRAVRALREHPDVYRAAHSSNEPDAAVVTMVRDLGSAVGALPVDTHDNAAPVELAYGVLREAYMLGDATTGCETLVDTLFDALARTLAPHVVAGVSMLPVAVRSWVRDLLPERASLLVDVSLHCSDEPSAQALRGEFITLLDEVFDGYVAHLPGDPARVWDARMVRGAALCLAASVEAGDFSSSWWSQRADAVAYPWRGWNLDTERANHDAVRGAWLIWVARVACAIMRLCGIHGWEALRSRAIAMAIDMREWWLWHATAPAPPTRDFVPLFVLEMAMLEPSADLVASVGPFVELTWNDAVLRMMADRVRHMNPGLASELEERRARLAVHSVSMGSARS